MLRGQDTCLKVVERVSRTFDGSLVSADDGCQATGSIAHVCGMVQMPCLAVQICMQDAKSLVADRPADHTVDVLSPARCYLWHVSISGISMRKT